MQTHAAAVFHRVPENLNCAQAVLDAYQQVSGRQVAAVADYKAFGGGRAPDNECGALYAACQCAPEAADQLRADFKAQAGSTRCIELKLSQKVPCKDCVALGASILDKHFRASPKQP